MMLLKIALIFTLAASALLVPPATGSYSVAMRVLPLEDKSRYDPYTPGQKRFRRVLLSVFLPILDKEKACPTQKVPYMTPAVAEAYGEQAMQLGFPNTTFAVFEYELCDLCKLSVCTQGPKFPVLVFDPGLGESRLLYGARARSLASHGYVVVTVDHPYDANVVEFPDGDIVLAAYINDTNTTAIEQNIQVRKADLTFVIDQLQNRTVMAPVLARFPGGLDFTKLAVYGHSLGGAASATVAGSDNRVRGGVDLDGQIFNPILTEGLSKPFILLGRPDYAQGDDSWTLFYARLRSLAMELSVAGTTHGSWNDVLILVTQLTLSDQGRTIVEENFGTIASQDMDRSLNGVLTAFFDFLFLGDRSPLGNLAPDFHNVTVVESKDLSLFHLQYSRIGKLSSRY